MDVTALMVRHRTAAVQCEEPVVGADGEMNPFDTETNLRVAPSARVPAATTLAQR